MSSLAEAELARWWRRQCRSDSFHGSAEKSGHSHPLTQIFSISRTRSGQQHIRELIQQRSDSHVQQSALSVALCGSLYHLLADAIEHADDSVNTYSEVVQLRLAAVDHLSRASKMDEEISWKAELQRAQWALSSAQCRLEVSCTAVERNAAVPVARVSVDDVDYEQFILTYAAAGKPVVITGAARLASSDGSLFTFEKIKRLVGHHQPSFRRYVSGRQSWAHLQDISNGLTIGDYIDGVVSGRIEGKSSLYVHDISIERHLPELLPHVCIPKYFCGNLLNRVEQSDGQHKFSGSWPSLFIGPSGSGSPLHIDSFASHFWMSMFQGTKKWTLYHPDDTHLLSPRWYESTSYSSTTFNTSNTLCGRAKCYTCELTAGDCLFVPSGWPHAVDNREASLSVSGNFVCPTNVQSVMDELNCMALVDGMAATLSQSLRELINRGGHLLDRQQQRVAASRQLDIDHSSNSWNPLKQLRAYDENALVNEFKKDFSDSEDEAEPQPKRARTE